MLCPLIASKSLLITQDLSVIKMRVPIIATVVAMLAVSVADVSARPVKEAGKGAVRRHSKRFRGDGQGHGGCKANATGAEGNFTMTFQSNEQVASSTEIALSSAVPTSTEESATEVFASSVVPSSAEVTSAAASTFVEPTSLAPTSTEAVASTTNSADDPAATTFQLAADSPGTVSTYDPKDLLEAHNAFRATHGE